MLRANPFFIRLRPGSFLQPKNKILGADHVIDYRKEDFTRNRQHYDLILAVNGYHPIPDYLRALSPGGSYVVAGGCMLQLFQAAFQRRRASNTASQKTHIVSLVQSQEDLIFMKEPLESEKVVPVIDGCYPLSKTAEALGYFEKEHAQGKIVITVEHDNKL
jgi:NADPH:quinone reductase-like Zn-dependent oxidoreductase